MKKFRSKNYTIPEGHYTGPQQPTTDAWHKAAFMGGAMGAAVNGLRAWVSTDDDDYKGMSSAQRVMAGASKGFVLGALSGIAVKGITEYINKPLTDIEFQKLDKNIRQEFGMYKIPVIGKTINNEKIKDMREKIVYNSKNITDYKLNFGIRRNQIVMYTFGVTDEELDSLSNALDEKVMTQPNMNYNASLINKSQNSYAVSITFTTYDIAAKYIVEAASIVSGKVNILDKDYLISGRINEFNVDKITEDPDEKAGINPYQISINNNINNNVINDEDEIEDDDSVKTFSLTGDEKYSALEFLRSDGGDTVLDIVKSIRKRKIGSTASNHLARLIRHSINRAVEKGKMKSGMAVERRTLYTDFLIDELTKLHYTKGFNYTIDKDNSECNMSMVSGIFVVSVEKGDKSDLVDEEFYNKAKDRVKRSEIDNVVSYTYSVVSRQDFEFLLKKLFSTKLKFNIIS